jgi:hypothetical protein
MDTGKRINEERLIEIINFIKEIENIPLEKRSSYLTKLSNKEIDYITEICFNFLFDRIKIDAGQLQILKRVSEEIRLLAKKNIKYKIKKNILKSIRGINILNILLPLALNVLTSLIE